MFYFLIQVDGHVSRDPSRLTRPTKGWEERMKHVGPSGGRPVLHMFHRSDCTFLYTVMMPGISITDLFFVIVTELFPRGDKACDEQVELL